MMMKRKRSSSREAMERTELSKEATKLLKEFQYLGSQTKRKQVFLVCVRYFFGESCLIPTNMSFPKNELRNE